MGIVRHGFVSKKQKNQRLRIIEGQKKRWRDNRGNIVSDDHNYSYCFTTQTGEMDLSAIADEIVVGNRVSDWRIGQRVVELAVLPDGLSACKRCGVPLHLMHASGIITYGLSAKFHAVIHSVALSIICQLGKGIIEFGMPTQS